MRHSDIMRHFRGVKKTQYFTHTHEWINFEDFIAYVGVCPFKLTGFDEVLEVDFEKTTVPLRQGDIIATFSCDDYRKNIFMPVDGKIKAFNEALLFGKNELILEHPLGNGWLAIIAPADPYCSKGLLTHDAYQLKQRNRQWGG
jgi:glycine cleavage system H protein